MTYMLCFLFQDKGAVSTNCWSHKDGTIDWPESENFGNYTFCIINNVKKCVVILSTFFCHVTRLVLLLLLFFYQRQILCKIRRTISRNKKSLVHFEIEKEDIFLLSSISRRADLSNIGETADV